MGLKQILLFRVRMGLVMIAMKECFTEMWPHYLMFVVIPKILLFAEWGSNPTARGDTVTAF